MTQQIINIGTLPNDGSGDPLRVAFQKINNNFTQLFETSSTVTYAYSYGDLANQAVFTIAANAFTQGTFTIRSTNTSTNDSQLVTILSQLNNDGDGVKFTAYGTTFYGNVLTNYDMDIFEGNVRLLVNPIPDVDLLHYVNSQVLYFPSIPEGLGIGLNGYTANSALGTENSNELSTQNP